MSDKGRHEPKISEAEAELGRAAEMLGEIVNERAEGDRDELRGNSDSDLLGAVEELEGAIRCWREDANREAGP